MAQLLVLGPVLSFRGAKDDKWIVTGLVGISKDVDIPELILEGVKCEHPRVLCTHKKHVFLRYDLTCTLQDVERKVTFGIGDELRWNFTVPGRGYAPRMAYVSCNGVSDPSAMRKLVRPANAVWEDLLSNHDKSLRAKDYLMDKEQLWHETRTHDKGFQRFHLLLMGGDQIYFDSIWEDVTGLKKWINLSRDEQINFKVTKALETEIENYYFGHYSQRWLPNERRAWGAGDFNRDCADALSRIPSIMMWDDHDIFDGWGSYSPEMQSSAVFKTLFKYARQAFWVFQMQHAIEDLPELATIERNILPRDPLYKAIDWPGIQATDALALPVLPGQPGFTSVYRVGPLALVAADLRTERSRTQVMGPDTWGALQSWMNAVATVDVAEQAKCQHLILLSSVPVAHPKLSFAEGFLDRFGQEHVTDSSADDLKDHWSHDDHEGERKRLLENLTRVAEVGKLRVSIVSGDVHVAAWGTAYRKDIPPTSNWAQIQQFTSSGVVHPSLVGMMERLFLAYLNSSAKDSQIIDVQYGVDMMLFPGHNQYVMPARNWLALELDTGKDNEGKCKLWVTWRCEAADGFSNHLHAVHPAQP